MKLRDYSALTLNTNFKIVYNNKSYLFKVVDLRPKNIQNAVSIIEADVNFDFAAPLDYVENNVGGKVEKSGQQQKEIEDSRKKIEEEKKKPVNRDEVDPSQLYEVADEDDEPTSNFLAFSGGGKCISGKPVPIINSPKPGSTTTTTTTTSTSTKSVSASSPPSSASSPPVPTKVILKNGKIEYATDLAQVQKERAEKYAQQKEEEKKKEGEYTPFSGQGYKLGKKN